MFWFLSLYSLCSAISLKCLIVNMTWWPKIERIGYIRVSVVSGHILVDNGLRCYQVTSWDTIKIS